MSRKRWLGTGTLALALLAGAGAGARPVAVGGVVQGPAVASRVLPGGEALAVWTLPRLGVAVRNDARDLRLLYGERELRYSPERGWRAFGVKLPAAPKLAVPQLVGGSLYVPLAALRLLGVNVIADAPDVLDFAPPAAVPVATLPPSPDAVTAQAPAAPAPTAGAPAQSPAPTRPTTPAPTSPTRPTSAPTPPAQPTSAPARPAPTPAPVAPVPAPPAPVSARPPAVSPSPPPSPPAVISVANLDTVRVSRILHRTVEVQRVVLELSREAPHQITREATGLSIALPGVTASPSRQVLTSGDTLEVAPQVVGGTARTTVHLRTGGGTSEVFTLDDPPRVVVDTTTYTDSRVPPPIDPQGLPDGVTYRALGGLHLLSFDPARFVPRVVTAPLGAARDVAALVRGVGGVAGVNGGYFDPASSLPVDLVAVGGLMTAPSLERRATVGFTAAGDPLFGYPRPRYVLSGPFGTVRVNSVGARARPDLLTAFVGDGRTTVGDDGLITLYLSPGAGAVAHALAGRNVPPAGTLSFTFDPARFPQLPRAAGQPLGAALNWQATDAAWPNARDALSAGPLLVQGGKVVLDPGREAFDTGAGIWRPTRQVAFGVVGGQPTIAYLEYGTPEAFAAALAGAGVRDAVRLDSGSSATAYVASGYGNLGGYLNTVWSRPVPNAIVFVPRGETAGR